MARIKITKLKAATLMEVLAAITIIMTVISISTVVFVNVTGSSYTAEKLRSILLINEVSLETQKSKAFFDEDFTKEGLLVSKKADKYNGSSELLLIHFAVYNESKKLLSERKEIVLVENE